MSTDIPGKAAAPILVDLRGLKFSGLTLLSHKSKPWKFKDTPDFLLFAPNVRHCLITQFQGKSLKWTTFPKRKSTFGSDSWEGKIFFGFFWVLETTKIADF